MSKHACEKLEAESCGPLCLPLFPMNHLPTARMKPTGQDTKSVFDLCTHSTRGLPLAVSS